MNFDLNFDQIPDLRLIVDHNNLNLNDLNNWLIISSDNSDEIVNTE